MRPRRLTSLKPQKNNWPTPKCAATSATPLTSSGPNEIVLPLKCPTGKPFANPRGTSTHTLRYLDTYLEQFEKACTAAGGKVHWAKDADEANAIITAIINSHGEKEVIKIKTMTSDEIRLNPALEAAGIRPFETDLADLIVQLGHDQPSHIVVPALHRNKIEIRQLFLEKMQLKTLGDKPEDLTDAARRYLREK